jgi:hypothetical protein
VATNINEVIARQRVLPSRKTMIDELRRLKDESHGTWRRDRARALHGRHTSHAHPELRRVANPFQGKPAPPPREPFTLRGVMGEAVTVSRVLTKSVIHHILAMKNVRGVRVLGDRGDDWNCDTLECYITPTLRMDAKRSGETPAEHPWRITYFCGEFDPPGEPDVRPTDHETVESLEWALDAAVAWFHNKDAKITRVDAEVR